MDEQVRVTWELLESLGAGGTPVVTVLNKCDLLAEEQMCIRDRFR